MTFVSYAQNFEDVLLWRALSGIAHGFYVDVGAAHPDTDSVTRAFYDRGWNGINVEPTSDLARRLRAARPRDVTLQLALGEASGESPFYTVPGTGLSSLVPASIAEARRHGFADVEDMVEVDTLAAVCRRHAPAEIHFLKVDVEGAERAVLAGADFDRFRPWIVLVEATRPMTTELSHAEWEPLLLRAGYRHVWFDGLNRFYLAAERHDDLSRHFTVPPNVADDFIRVADTDWARLVHRAEGATQELRQRAENAELRGALAELRADALGASLQRGHEAVLKEVRAANQAALEFEWARSGKAEQALAAMLASTSWRITAPLRRAMSLLRKPRPYQAPAEAPLADPAPEAPPATRPALPLRPVPAATMPARRAVRQVHQFHSGVSVGDAITNGMLLTRGLLRQLGYESDIFVHRQDLKLQEDIRLLDDMPRHADQVLIVHHSLGHDRLDEVLSLPARKILCYHNITPPELLADDPWLAAHAELGRQQLHQLRPHVAASLAVSDYNAVELRALGFDPVQTCTLLFDVDALRAKAVPRPAGAPACFTVLFVGRVLASKGQLDLLEAYMRFRQAFTRPSRLVLIGRLDLAAGYLDKLTARIAEAGIQEHVLMLGHVADRELDAWYATADLYVSLSRHEGFGVPLIEAATRGVPVLAWAGGAVPYTLEDPAGLLFGRDPELVAARMLDLAGDPAALGALRQSQLRAADRFRLDRQLPALVQALALAGAAPPSDPATRAAMDRHLCVTVMGHANGSYSLASVNRTLAAALDAARPGQARLVPIEGGPAPLRGVPGDSPVRALAERPPFVTGPQVVVSNHYPVHVPADPGDVALALFYWEESLIPPETIANLNARFRGVLAATTSVAKALIDSGLTIPVQVLGQAMDLAPFQALAARRPRPAGTPVTFLHVSSCFPRKGVDVLLAAYARAFRAGDPVRLVIKGFPNPHNDVAAQIAALRACNPALAPIELIDRDIEAEELLALYAEADAMVLPSRGEGFNMAAAEAMAAGLPLIVTGAGGHADFCTPDTARLLKWRHAPSQTHLAVAQSLWFEPDEEDLAAALRETAAACRGAGPAAPALTERTRAAAHAIAVATDGATVAARLRCTALDLLLLPPARRHRIAMVTSWGVRCGVAEYSRHLVASYAKCETGPDVVVLADARERAAEAPPALTAWRQGDDASMDDLLGAILREDADIVMIQHQPGLFGFAALATLLRSQVLRRRVVTVTLHTVQQLEETASPERTDVIAALGLADRVIVHTLKDLERLRHLGLVANATLIPQGTQAPDPLPPVRDIGRGDGPRIGCYGFFLPGKGIPELIRAVSLLRVRWPNLRLRLVNAEYDSAESRAEIARARTIAQASGMDDVIEWHLDFLKEQDSRALLAECDAVAVATQESREGSSASLRSAMAAGAPLIVTPLSFFEEAGDAVARFPDVTPTAMAEGLETFLVDAGARRATQAAARAWLDERSWAAIGPRTYRMLLGLAATRSANLSRR